MYLVVSHDGVVELVHQVMHHPQEPQRDRVARVELDHAFVRGL